MDWLRLKVAENFCVGKELTEYRLVAVPLYEELWVELVVGFACERFLGV